MAKIIIGGDSVSVVTNGAITVNAEVGQSDTGDDDAAAEFKIIADPDSNGQITMWLFDGFGGPRIDFHSSDLNYTLRLVPVDPGNEGDGGLVGNVQTYKVSTETFGGTGAKNQIRVSGSWPGDNHVSVRHEGAADESYRALVTGNGTAQFHIGFRVVA